MPSIPSFFHHKAVHTATSNRSSTTLPPTPTAASASGSASPLLQSPSSRPSSAAYGRHHSISSNSSATIQLVPDHLSAADGFSTSSPLPPRRREDGGSSSSNSPNNSRKPVGLNSLFSGTSSSSLRDRPPPPSPRIESGVGRRVSVRHSHKQQPLPPPPPPSTQLYQPQQQEKIRLDPYLPTTQSPGKVSPEGGGGSGRPQSMLSTSHEAEPDTYPIKRSDTDPSHQQQHNAYPTHPQQQRQDNLGNIHQQLQPQQNHQQQQQQQQYHDAQSYQQNQQGSQMVPQIHSQPRRSMESAPVSQPGPLSREVSGLSQMQQNYNQARPASDYQGGGGGGGGGSAQVPGGGGTATPTPYDPAKYEGQPLGRMTPDRDGQRSSGGQSGEGVNVAQMMQELETLQAKYRKVKNLYFDRSSEIERLQNTLAHQRLAQSRTSLDDNEYASRFERLDGAIKNVAFEIRQSWKSIPAWLGNVVNAGAELKGGREMTVVGRASISRWVVDEVLEQFFHPALDVNLSAQLKLIEHSIRKNAPPPSSVEEDDALSTKVCNWRLTTLDALYNQIHGQHAMEFRGRLSEHLVIKLVESLQMHLHDPAPPGLLGGVQMIVDIAVGISANLPLESRDVRVWYPLPGERFDEKFMKSEGGLPPLLTSTNAHNNVQSETASECSEKTLVDSAQQKQYSTMGGGEGGSSLPPPAPEKDLPKQPNPSQKAGIGGLPPQQATTAVNAKESAKKAALGLSGRMKKALSGTSSSSQGGVNNTSSSSLSQQAPPSPGTTNGKPTIIPGSQISLPSSASQSGGGKEEDGRVRIAGFMAVEVRGRSILCKAPVWL